MSCFHKKCTDKLTKIDYEWEGKVVLSQLSTFTPTSVEAEHIVKWRCFLVKACFDERTFY